MNEPTGTLKGKDKVSSYWSIALTKFPDLKFRLIDVFYSVSSITIYYHSIHRKTNSVEFFLLGPDGKVIQSIAHYL